MADYNTVINGGSSYNATSNAKGSTGGDVHRFNMYIINLLTGTKVLVRIFPDEVSESLASQWEEVVPRGRSNPIYGYSSSGPRTVSYTLQLHDDYLTDGILTTVNHLRSLTYPAYNGGSISPPKCMIRVGNNIKFTGICKEVSVTWMKPMRDGQYIMAEVSLTFDEVQSPAQSSVQVSAGDFTS